MKALKRVAPLALGGAISCATTSSPDLGIRVHDEPMKPVRYEGRIVGPHDDIDDMVDAACDTMLNIAQGERPLGYCATYFSDETQGSKWFFSHISPVKGTPGAPERTCDLPRDPVEPDRKEVLFLGGVLGGSKTNPEYWRPTHFFSQTAGESWWPDTLVFSLEPSGACTVYTYVGFSRVVTVRRDGDFIPTGTIYNEQGIIQTLKSAE